MNNGAGEHEYLTQLALLSRGKGYCSGRELSARSRVGILLNFAVHVKFFFKK